MGQKPPVSCTVLNICHVSSAVASETPGEDSYLSGEYAKHFVGGMQNSEVDPSHWQAGATCKHFVANSMEHTTEVGVTHDRAGVQQLSDCVHFFPLTRNRSFTRQTRDGHEERSLSIKKDGSIRFVGAQSSTRT